jgi:hypothetical protein
MALTHPAPGVDVDRNRPYKHEAISNLVTLLKQQCSEGIPYDDAVVAEVATRAYEAEHPGTRSDRF